MKCLRMSMALAVLLAGVAVARAQPAIDMKGSWTPTEGAHMIDGPTKHHESGTERVPGQDRLERHTSKFTFHFDGQDGRTFWGTHASAKVKETLMGVLSVDGKRFVMVDEDGTFSGEVVDNDTLDYCYTHVTPTNRAVACGLLVRDK